MWLGMVWCEGEKTNASKTLKTLGARHNSNAFELLIGIRAKLDFGTQSNEGVTENVTILSSVALKTGLHSGVDLESIVNI